jgi:hypothetical protein
MVTMFFSQIANLRVVVAVCIKDMFLSTILASVTEPKQFEYLALNINLCASLNPVIIDPHLLLLAL